MQTEWTDQVEAFLEHYMDAFASCDGARMRSGAGWLPHRDD
jgi:hypothetical protein